MQKTKMPASGGYNGRIGRVNNIGRGYRVPFLLVSMLFLLWGVANNMNDTLLAAFRRIMSMSDLQTSLVQSAFYGAYFCIAIPAALFISRFSYKAGVILGLGLYAVGTMLFYPAGVMGSYGFFLISIYVMASGCAVLETTANPYVLSMGPAKSATRRLNIAQTLNPLGALTGILVSRHFILSELNTADAAERAGMGTEALRSIQQHEFDAVSGAYMLIGCVLVAMIAFFIFIRMPGARDSEGFRIRGVFARLWRDRKWRYGVVAQFFYVGVQTAVWSFVIRLAMERLGILEKDAALYFIYSIAAFSLFRFVFTWLMGYVRPVKLLVGASLCAIALMMAVIFAEGAVSVYALIAVSGCMSLMFPTIYGIALGGIGGTDTKLAASGLIMAILGGALITPVQAYISDRCGIGSSFWVSAICFVAVLAYSLWVVRANRRIG